MFKIGDVIRDTSLFAPQSQLSTNMVIHNVWKDFHGISTTLKDHIKIKMIKNDILYLQATDGIWAQEILLQKDTILDKLNKSIKRQIPYKLKSISVFAGN